MLDEIPPGRTKPTAARRIVAERNARSQDSRGKLQASADAHLGRFVRRRQEDRPADLEDIARWSGSRSWPPIPSSIRGVRARPRRSKTASRGPRPCSFWPKSQCRNNQNRSRNRHLRRGRPGRRHASSRTGCAESWPGFLVDSLIATGRFEDARACIVLYPDGIPETGRSGSHRRGPGEPRRGGVGPALDRHRGSRTIPPDLYRRVTTGVLVRSSRTEQGVDGPSAAPESREPGGRGTRPAPAT